VEILNHKRFPFVHQALDLVQVNAGGGHILDQVEVEASRDELTLASTFLGTLTVRELNQFCTAMDDGVRVGTGYTGWAEANRIVDRFYEEK
jgi:hypothetical protein